MKIQYIAIIFIIIILPISIVTSSYIDSRIETIKLQADYNNKLVNATYDAVKAFQINTVNNRYSSVSNSKIRDIEASINTFYNSLINSEKLSKEDLKPYVPALVFSLYDGYYIYSKYDNAYMKDNGQPVINEEELKKDQYTNYGLKPYIYYSCRYRKDDKEFVVNYTLDNAITIYGNFGSENEYTLSGYLINYGKVKDIIYDENNPLNWNLKYNGIEIDPEVLTEHVIFEDGTNGDYTYITYNGQKIYRDNYEISAKDNEKYFWYQNYEKKYINDEKIVSYAKQRDDGVKIYSTSAFEYYYNAYNFSQKVEDLIGDIKQENAIDENGNPIEFSTNTGKDPIFGNLYSSNDPLISGSTFNENRIAVIRKSIETNLSAAIANYNIYSGDSYEFAMPVLSDEDWVKMADNVSITAFLQGIPIGHKYYNNYCVITNDNNEEVVKRENIYIVTKNDNDTTREYHLPGCTHLIADVAKDNIVGAYSNLSFTRQTVRKGEGDYIYFYPQNIENKTITSCYYCIVNASDTYLIDDIINGQLTRKNANNWEDESITLNNNQDYRFQKIRQLYLTALARERYDLYQANMDAFNTD